MDSLQSFQLFIPSLVDMSGVLRGSNRGSGGIHDRSVKACVELDTGGQRLDKAAMLFQEGVSLLQSVMKATPDAVKKARYRDKIEQYLKLAEELKKHLNNEKEGLTLAG